MCCFLLANTLYYTFYNLKLLRKTNKTEQGKRKYFKLFVVILSLCLWTHNTRDILIVTRRVITREGKNN